MTELQIDARPLVLRRRLGPAIVVVLGLLVTLALFWNGRKASLDDYRLRLTASANARLGSTIQEIDDSLFVLEVLGQFVAKKERLEKGDYLALAAPLLETSRSMNTIGWIPRVREPKGDYSILYRHANRSGTPADSAFKPSPALRSVFERSRAEGKAVTTWWTDGFPGVDRPNLLLVVPVYRSGQGVTKKDSRDGAFLGFNTGVMRPDAVLRPFLDRKPEFAAVEIVDDSSVHRGRVLVHRSATEADSGRSGLARFLPSYAPHEVKVDRKGEAWRIRITPGDVFMRQYFNLSYWLILPGGLTVTVLLALFLGSLISQRDRMERVVRDRTARLREHEQHLEELVRERTRSLEWKSAFLEALIESSSDGILVVDDRGNKLFANGRTVELWKMPQEILAKGDGSHVCYMAGMVRGAEEFTKKVEYLNNHPDESARDEIELADGTVLDRFSSPVYGPDGACYGRIWSFHDITERKAAEEALRRSRLQLSDAMDLTRIVHWEADPAVHEFVFNDPFYALFATTAELEGGYRMPVDDYLKRFVHPDDLSLVQSRSRQAAEEGVDLTQLEHRAIRRNGEVMYLLTQARYVKDETGQLIRIYGANQDITQRKLAEQKVIESENKFRDLAEKSIVGVYLVQDGRFKYVNSRFAEIHGYSPEEMIEKKKVEDTVLPEDIHILRGRTVRTDSEDTSGRFQLGLRIVRKQGDIRNVEIYGSHTAYQGKGAVVGTLVDVTERKKTEEALRWKTAFLEAQVNSSLDGILVIDSVGRTILQNRRMIDVWKIPQALIDEKDNRRQLSHAMTMTKYPETFKTKVLQLHSHPDQTGRDEIELKDGTVLDSYSCPVLGKQGEYYGRIWIFRDITELRHYWDMLENLSTTDGLTDLPNRRRFDEFLNREWRRSMRDESLMSLILMDIDFFKEFNDHYGHLAGDDCLRQLARTLKGIVQRPGDLVARYGGEEFACVLTGTDSAGAVALAHRIRERMEHMNIPHYYSAVADHVTLSFGVASMAPEKGESASQLIQLADNLLYAAKQSGRDQVKSWRQAAKGRRISAK